jgi:hypothetical protein
LGEKNSSNHVRRTSPHLPGRGQHDANSYTHTKLAQLNLDWRRREQGIQSCAPEDNQG